MDLLEKAAVQSFHRQRLQDGHIKALGYRDESSQTRRFEAILGWGDMANSSILDLGCGFGDLRPFILNHFESTVYLGIDFLKEFVEEAKIRYGELPQTQFFQADFMTAGLPEIDCVIASGSLNYRSENNLHPWQSISRMWEIAQRGVVFNLLDQRHFGSTPLLCGYDPQEVLDYCRQLDPNSQIYEGYLPDDFTIYMHK